MELKHHWRYEKMLTLDEAKEKAAELRVQGKRLVTVNGSFDLLHAGHVQLIIEAKSHGDVLFVGLNSDKSIQEGKDKNQPYVSEGQRAAMLAALACVDYVFLTNAPYGTTHDVLIEAVRPHVHVNSSFYGEPREWAEWPTMERLGVEGYMVEANQELTTETIVEKIKSFSR